MSGNLVDYEIKLHTEIYGTGSPIVFLHGFGATLFSWRKLVPSFSKDFKLILFDLKGFGGSSKPKDGSYSINEQARLIVQYIEEQGLEDVVLVGHSFGGGVALAIAINLIHKIPRRLSKLILIDSIAFKQPFPIFIKILRIPLLGAFSTAFLPSQYQARFALNLAYRDNKKIPEEAVKAYAKNLETPEGQYALIQTASQIIPKNLNSITDKFSLLKIPTLIIWGEEDKIIPLKFGELLHKAIPNSEMKVIKNCGHIPHEETPEEVIPLLKKFLNF